MKKIRAIFSSSEDYKQGFILQSLKSRGKDGITFLDLLLKVLWSQRNERYEARIAIRVLGSRP